MSYTLDQRMNYNSGCIRMLLGCRIALRYAKGPPSKEDLMRDFGMSRAAAYRWVNAMNEARLLEGLAGSAQKVR